AKDPGEVGAVGPAVPPAGQALLEATARPRGERPGGGRAERAKRRRDRPVDRSDASVSAEGRHHGRDLAVRGGGVPAGPADRVGVQEGPVVAEGELVQTGTEGRGGAHRVEA